MNLDLLTVSVLTALVVVTSVVFIVGMLLRKDESAGRIWGLGFLAALLTVVAYLAWAASPEAWWAVAVGNAAFLCGTGLMWLGARRFNDGNRLAKLDLELIPPPVRLTNVLQLADVILKDLAEIHQHGRALVEIEFLLLNAHDRP